MNSLFLLDVAPDPVSTVGLGVVIILAVVILASVVVMVGAFVFLLVRRKRRNANTALVAGVNAPQSGS